jgi:hypothetical protein
MANRERLAVLTIVLAAIGFAGCIMYPVPGMEQAKSYVESRNRSNLGNKASFTMSGNQLMLRNDDQEVWHAATVTLDTDQGFFRQKAGDIPAGEVRVLPLEGFFAQAGKPINAQMQLKSVWVHTTYGDGRVVDEMAFPATSFGLKPVKPPGG